MRKMTVVWDKQRNIEEVVNDVREHYNILLGDFFKAIDGIDIKGLPAVHIPVVGSSYGVYRKIAIYGMEGKDWKDMSELKSAWDTGDAYKYLTEDFISMNLFDNFKKVKTNSFFGFIVKFLARLYDIEWDEKGGMISLKDKEESQRILQSFIWGNIHTLERHNKDKNKKESDEKEPDNWKKIRKESKKIFDMHLFVSQEEYDPCKDQLRYMLETCRPEVLLILHWDFNFGTWLEKNYNTTWIIADRKNYFCYAHIKTDKIDTHVYKCDHPRNMKKRGENFVDIIDRIKNALNRILIRSFYEQWIQEYLIKNNSFISTNGRTIKLINNDISIFLDISSKDELLIGFENKNSNIEEKLVKILNREHFNKYFSKVYIDKQSHSIYKKYLRELNYQTSIIAVFAFLRNSLSELEYECRKLI